MKKALVVRGLSIFSAFAVMLGMFTGCGSSSGKSSSSTVSVSATEKVSGVDLQKMGPALKKIYDRGTVIVGNDSSYPPFGFIDTSTNKPIGVEKEMATAIADKLTKVLGKKITLDFESMNFNAVLSSLTTGKIDLICSCCSVTADRKKVMDFSNPYMQTKDVCLILAKNKSSYKTLDDFKNKKLAANIGSSQEIRAKKLSSNVTSTPTISDAILQLTAGKVDAIVVDNITAYRYSLNSTSLYSFELSDKEIAPVDKAVGMQKGNDDLKAIVNAAVKEETASGNVQKWISEYSKKAAEMGLNK